MELKRDIDPVLLAAMSDPAGWCPCVLISSDWPDGTAHVFSGGIDLPWNGETWIAVGHNIAAIEVSPEGGGLVPGEATLTIAGAIETVLSYADPAAKNGLVRIWIGATTAPGGSVLKGEPYNTFAGYIDFNQADFDFATGAARLGVGVGTGPSAREHAAIAHSAEDQKARHPGDTFFDRVANADQWRKFPIQFPNPA